MFVDAALPFRLRSTPKIFTVLTEWIVRKERGDFVIHYLDDFLVMGRPGTDECGRALDTLLKVFQQLGFQTSWRDQKADIARIRLNHLELSFLLLLERQKTQGMQLPTTSWCLVIVGACQIAFNFLKMFGEIGNLSLLPIPFLASSLLTP